jgi:hypothetical protein
MSVEPPVFRLNSTVRRVRTLVANLPVQHLYGKFKKIYNLVLASSQRIGYGAPVNGILCQIEVSVI